MRSLGRTSLVVALLVAGAALTSCTGIGAVDRQAVTAEAQARGGGITTALVADAVAAVADETGADLLAAHSITAGLAMVTVVVPSGPGDAAQAWRYGTSGQYGGRGLDDPAPSGAPGAGAFPVDEAGLGGIDAAVDLALATADLAGGWVESVTVARPAEGAAPVTTLVVADGVTERPVVVAADGTLVEGAR